MQEQLRGGKSVCGWTILEILEFGLRITAQLETYIYDETALLFWNDFWHLCCHPFRIGSSH